MVAIGNQRPMGEYPSVLARSVQSRTSNRRRANGLALRLRA